VRVQFIFTVIRFDFFDGLLLSVCFKITIYCSKTVEKNYYRSVLFFIFCLCEGSWLLLIECLKIQLLFITRCASEIAVTSEKIIDKLAKGGLIQHEDDVTYGAVDVDGAQVGRWNIMNIKFEPILPRIAENVVNPVLAFFNFGRGKHKEEAPQTPEISKKVVKDENNAGSGGGNNVVGGSKNDTAVVRPAVAQSPSPLEAFADNDGIAKYSESDPDRFWISGKYRASKWVLFNTMKIDVAGDFNLRKGEVFMTMWSSSKLLGVLDGFVR
jgi:hypothetical protein